MFGLHGNGRQCTLSEVQGNVYPYPLYTIKSQKRRESFPNSGNNQDTSGQIDTTGKSGHKIAIRSFGRAFQAVVYFVAVTRRCDRLSISVVFLPQRIPA